MLGEARPDTAIADCVEGLPCVVRLCEAWSFAGWDMCGGWRAAQPSEAMVQGSGYLRLTVSKAD